MVVLEGTVAVLASALLDLKMTLLGLIPVVSCVVAKEDTSVVPLVALALLSHGIQLLAARPLVVVL